MFDNLSERLDGALKTLKGQGRITDVNIATTIKEIRRALVDADVNFKVAKTITDEIKEEAIGQKVMTAVKPGQLFVKIVNDKLIELMGGETAPFNAKGSPGIILIAGLQGSGKTTFTGKLGAMLKKQGQQVLLTACDVYRPAAIEQLKTLGQQVGVEVYSEPDNKNPLQIAQNAIKHAVMTGKSTVIVDTAGRLAIDEQMMQEITSIKQTLKPQETLFVVDSMTGQDAVNTAKAFNDRLNFDGVVLTKLDGDTRGGAALSIRSVVTKPIKFVSTGEKMDAIDRFHPDRMARRILGMGDVVSLVEKAQQVYDEEEARKLNKKLRANQFDFEDLRSQLNQLKKMGSLKDLMKMIPGMGKMMKGVELDDDAFKPFEAIIDSMTPEERRNPDVITAGRKQRLANGSGTSVQQVNALYKQFSEMRKMIKQMNKMQPNAAGPGKANAKSLRGMRKRR